MSSLAGSEVCIHLKSPLTKNSKFNFYESFSCIRPFPQSPISSAERTPTTKLKCKPQRAHTEESHKVNKDDFLLSAQQKMRRFYSVSIEIPSFRGTKDKGSKRQSLAENKADASAILDPTFLPSCLSCTQVNSLRNLQGHQHFESTPQNNKDFTKVCSLCQSESTDLATKANSDEAATNSQKPFYRRFTTSWPISLNYYG